MATSFTMEIGYMADGDPDEAWDKLVETAHLMRHRSDRIYRVAMGINAPPVLDDLKLSDFCDIYQQPPDMMHGSPLSFHNDEFGKRILVSVSGDTPSQKMKRYAARAFCMLVMQRMHEHDFEVSLIVS